MGSSQEKTSPQKVNHKQRKIDQLRLDSSHGHYWISLVVAEKTNPKENSVNRVIQTAIDINNDMKLCTCITWIPVRWKTW